MQGLTESLTVLLPNNTVLVEAFAALADQFNILDPDSFLERMIPIADITYRPPGPPIGTDIIGTDQESAGVVLRSMLFSNVVLGAYDFYINQTVRPMVDMFIAWKWPGLLAVAAMVAACATVSLGTLASRVLRCQGPLQATSRRKLAVFHF